MDGMQGRPASGGVTRPAGAAAPPMDAPARGAAVAKVLRAMGSGLVVVGAAGWLLPDGPVHWTAAIPAILGVLALLASLAGRRPLVAAALGAAVALLALAGGGSALGQLPALVAGEAGAAVASRAATALVALAGLAGLALALRRRDG